MSYATKENTRHYPKSYKKHQNTHCRELLFSVRKCWKPMQITTPEPHVFLFYLNLSTLRQHNPQVCAREVGRTYGQRHDKRHPEVTHSQNQSAISLIRCNMTPHSTANSPNIHHQLGEIFTRRKSSKAFKNLQYCTF